MRDCATQVGEIATFKGISLTPDSISAMIDEIRSKVGGGFPPSAYAAPRYQLRVLGSDFGMSREDSGGVNGDGVGSSDGW